MTEENLSSTLDPVQECRVYEHSEWYRLIDYVLYLKHSYAYRYILDDVRDKQVLDFGCGSGYGSYILSETAGEVIGADASENALAYAQEHYDRPNLSFQLVPANYTLPFEDNRFDYITSHQVIEHVGDVTAYLEMLKRVLRPGGKLYMATPNRKYRLLPFQRIWQKAHAREYTAEHLRSDLSKVFDDFEVLGVYGEPEFQKVYVDAYRQTPFRAYVRQPIRDFAQAVIPREAYVRLRDAIGAKAPAPPREPVPQEVLSRYSSEQVTIGPDLDRAIDFFAVCTKT